MLNGLSELWKVKSVKIKPSNNSKSCLGYFNKLVDEYNNTYDYSIIKKTFDADYSALIEKNWDKSYGT